MTFNWTVEFLNQTARREILEMPEDIRVRFSKIVDLIEGHGLEKVHEPYIKHLEDKLWEMRMKGKDGIARSIYVTAKGKRVVVLHSFIKKTQKTPDKALELARKRAKELNDE